MIKTLRKHRQWLMWVIAILALPFCLYFVKTDPSKIRSEQFARLYDREVSMIEAQRNARLFELARGLGMITFLNDLVGGTTRQGADIDEVHRQFALNLIILRHEADRLGVRPSAAEKADFVRNLGIFKGSTGFDMNKYREFADTALPANGFSEVQIDELAGDELTLNRIKQLVGTGVALPENESKTEYDRAHAKLFASAIRMRPAEFEKEIKITDDDVRKYYESHKTEYKTAEKRKVEFVSLALNDEQKKLSGRERIDVLQKLADRANDFTQALLEKGADFHQVAAKFQLPVQATGEFDALVPDPKLKVDPQLGSAAFQLTTQEPNSDAIQTPEGFYVLHLTGIVEARPLTLEEAKQKVVDTIKASRARELMATKGAKIAHDLPESLRAGEPPAAALQKLNVKAEKVEPFTLMDDVEADDAAENPQEKPKDKAKDKQKDKPKDFIAIKNAAANLQPGEVSSFFPWEDGGLVVFLEKKEPPDEKVYQEKKSSFVKDVLDKKRTIVFYEWFRDRQREAGIVQEKTEPPAPKRRS